MVMVVVVVVVLSDSSVLCCFGGLVVSNQGKAGVGVGVRRYHTQYTNKEQVFTPI